MAARCRILIVTGAPDCAESVAAVLKRTDLELEYERVDSLAALDAALARTTWDIVISDHVLGGRAALQLARRRAADTPFVVVCDGIGEEGVVELMREGARDVVSKQRLARLGQVVVRELADARARQEHRLAASAQQQAEQHLREREARYRRIVDTAAEGIWELGADGRTTFVNSRTAELLGRAAEELLGRPLTEFMFEEDVPDHERRMQRRRRDIAERYERRFRRKDGQTVWVLVAATPLFEQERFRGSFAVLTDFTERKRAEDELREERRLFLGGHCVAFKWEARPGWPVAYVSPNIVAELGYAPEALTSGRLSYASLIHSEDLQRVDEEVAANTESGVTSFEQEYRLAHASGEYRWVYDHTVVVRDAGGAPVQYYGYIHDITERKRSDEALRASLRSLRALSKCNQALMRAADEHTLLDEICQIVCDEAGYRMAWVGYLDPSLSEQLRTVAVHRLDTWNTFGRRSGALAHAPEPAWMASQAGTTVCIPDIAVDPRTEGWRAGALEQGHRSALALPLRDQNASMFGVLCVYSSQANRISDDELRLMEELAGDLAFGIVTIRARVERQRTARDAALMSCALDCTREAAFLIDETSHFRHVNREASRVLGYTRDELLRMSVADVDPDVPLRRWLEHWNALKSTGSLRFEGRHRTKDGRIVPVEINATYIEYEAQGYNLALVRDITDRKQAEDALRTREQFLTTLLDNIPDHVTRFDSNGRILFINRAVTRSFGLSPDVDVGKTTAEIDRPTGSRASNRRLFQSLMRAIESGTPNEIEATWQTTRGDRVFEVRHVPVKDETGTSTSAIGIGRDITDRKRAESERERLLHEVEQERERLSVVLNTAPVGIGLFLAPEGRTALLNEAAEELLAAPDRRSATALELQRDARLPDGEPFPAEALPLRRALAGESVTGVEVVLRHPSGRELHVIENSAPVRNPRGAVVGAVLTFQDVSAVRELDRLRDDFLAAVAHELQTPVTSMAAYAELLSRRTQKEDPRTAHAATVILNQAHRIGRRVQEMAEVSRLQRGSTVSNMRRFDLGDLAARAVSDLRRSSKTHVALDREHPAPVQGDAERIEDVLRALLEFANEASPTYGGIEVRVWRDADHAFVSVRDHGPGIPKDRQPHVFEPFYLAAPPGARGYRGTVPLSPYLSKLTVQKHGGHIWLESEEGMGSTFFFSLPLARETAEQPAAPPP